LSRVRWLKPSAAKIAGKIIQVGSGAFSRGCLRIFQRKESLLIIGAFVVRDFSPFPQKKRNGSGTEQLKASG
jgi:hypothetical protein